MVSAVGAASVALSASPASAAGGPARRSPSLDAQLNTARAQLEDWVTCPSSKTPEGKAKIEQVTAKVNAIKQQIETADKATAKTTNVATATPADTAPKRPFSTLGANVDTWA